MELHVQMEGGAGGLAVAPGARGDVHNEASGTAAAPTVAADTPAYPHVPIKVVCAPN